MSVDVADITENDSSDKIKVGKCFLCFVECSNLCERCGLVWYCCDDHLSIHVYNDTCLPFKVDTLPGVGRMVTAVRDIKAGELILTEVSPVWGPANKTRPVCVGCCVPWRVGGDTCPRCGWPVCGDTCRDGPLHQLECHVLAKCPPELRPQFTRDDEDTNVFAVILPLRLAMLARRGDNLAGRLALLMDHREDIETRNEFQSKWKSPVVEFLTEKFDSGVTAEELYRGIGIYITNAANMAPSTGRWILPTFSFLSHSCVSNSRFFISPSGVVRVRAQVDIRAGDEVTISYLPPQRANIVRRKTIQDLWHFTCTCPRCQDVSELGTCLSGVTCRQCDGASTMLPRDSDMTSPYTCRSCDKLVSHDTITALINSIDEQTKHIKESDILPMIKKLEDILHPNNYLILDLKQKFVDVTMDDKSKKDQKTLEKIVDFIKDIIKVNNKIEPGLTVTLGTNLRHLNTSMLSLAKMKLESKEIDKKEFMMTAMIASENIKLAKKCFDDIDFETWK